MFRWLTDMLTPRPHPTPPWVQVLSREMDFPGSQSGGSISTHEGPSHSSVPLGTLSLRTKVPYGAQPSLVRNLRGLGFPWHLLKSRLAQAVGGLTPAGRRGSSCNPGASRSLPRTRPPAHPPSRQATPGWVASPGVGEGGLPGQERAPVTPRRRSDPKHQEIILYNHPMQRYFLKSVNYFSLFSDPTFFFSLQLHVGDSFTSGKP